MLVSKLSNIETQFMNKIHISQKFMLPWKYMYNFIHWFYPIKAQFYLIYFDYNAILFLITCHMIVARYYGFTLVICVSVCRTSIQPYFRFWMITWVNVNGFSPNLVCALILCRSGLGLLMGKFHRFFTELPAWDMPLFSFSNYILSKYWWIFTKLVRYYACGAFIFSSF